MSKQPILLDIMARRYGVMPHTLMNIDFEDLQLDYLCFELGIVEDEKVGFEKDQTKKMAA